MKNKSKWLKFTLISINLILAGVASAPRTARAANAAPCIADLSLLDTQLLQVLDQYSNLIRSSHEAEPHSGFDIVLSREVKALAQKLENTITDEATRTAAKAYLKQKISTDTEVSEARDEKDIRTEAQARRKENGLLSPFQHIENLSHFYPTTTVTSRGDIFRLSISKEANYKAQAVDSIIVENLSHPGQAIVMLSDTITGATRTQYFPKTSQLIVMGSHGLYSIEIPKKIKPGLTLKVSTLFDLTHIDRPDDDRAFTQAFKDGVKRSSPKDEPRRHLENPRLSKDGRVYAAIVERNIVIFNSKTGKFKFLDIGLREIRSGGWDLSPDGKHIAVVGLRVYIFDTSTGELINELPLSTVAITFSNDSTSVIANDSGGLIVVQNFLDASGKFRREYHTRPVRGWEHLANYIYMTQDGEKIIASTADEQISIWSLTSIAPHQIIDTHHHYLRLVDGGRSFITTQDPLPSYLSRDTEPSQLWGR